MGSYLTGKLTTFRENLEHLIEETKGDVKTAKESKTESKKESKKEAKKAKETVTEEELDYELEAELAEETEQTPKSEKNAAVGNKTKPTDSETGTPTEIKNAPAEEDEMVELVSDLYDSEVKGGRLYSAENTNTEWISNRFKPFTSEDIKRIKYNPKNTIANSRQDIVSFLESVPGKNTDERLFVGKLNDNLVKRVKEQTGVDVNGKSLVLSSSDTRHLFNEHGNEETEKLRGQKAITKDNFFDVIETILNFDRVISETMADGTNHLVFEKENNGKITAVTVVSNAKKALILKTARMTKKEQRISPPSDAKAPNSTPKSELSMNAVSDNSINNYSQNVNTPEAISKNMYSAEDTDVILPSEDTYEYFASKPDMEITQLDGSIPTSRQDAILRGKQNVADVGTVSENGTTSVHNNDVGRNIVVGADGIRHGLARSNNFASPNYVVVPKVGEILKNAVRVNEINPKREDVKKAYVLVGLAQDTNGDTYIVRFVVNSFDNELVSMDVLYAANAKKESAAQNAPGSTGNPQSVTDSKISIADLLSLVNNYFPDILPMDVLKHFGHTVRPAGDLGHAVLYSSSDTDILPDTDILLPDITSRSMRRDLTTLESAKDINGDRLYNYKAMEADEEEYRKMLKKHGGLADNEIEELFNTVDAVVDRIKETIESDAELARAIDFGWERDIDDRAYSPIKQNSDKLYKVSLDFSTMCRKHILQQITQSQIQEAMDKTLDANESIAVRQALAKLIDMGFQIEVACKLCFVICTRIPPKSATHKEQGDR